MGWSFLGALDLMLNAIAFVEAQQSDTRHRLATRSRADSEISSTIARRIQKRRGLDRHDLARREPETLSNALELPSSGVVETHGRQNQAGKFVKIAQPRAANPVFHRANPVIAFIL